MLLSGGRLRSRENVTRNIGKAKLPGSVPASGPSSNMKNRKLGILFIVRMVENALNGRKCLITEYLIGYFKETYI